MRAVLLVATLLAGGCSGPSERDVSATSKTPAAMTNTDPSDPKAWAEAQAIAAAQGVGDVSKRSAALPFMFQADRVLRAVLIHKGSVVKTRGPATAGAYLRDLGIAQGKGPQLDDVLWAIWALEALPDVKPLPPESYVNNTTSPRLADRVRRHVREGGAALPEARHERAAGRARAHRQRHRGLGAEGRGDAEDAPGRPRDARDPGDG